MKCVSRNTNYVCGVMAVWLVMFLAFYLSFASTSFSASANQIQSPPSDGKLEGLGISPSKIEMIVQPNSETSLSINVTNHSDTKMKLSFSAWNFARDEHGSALPISKADGTRFRGAAEWISSPGQLDILAAGENKKIDVKVKVPKKVKSGTHYAYLRVFGLPIDDQPEDESLQVRFVLDALFLPMVISESHQKQIILTTKAKMGRFKPTGFWNFQLPVGLAAKVRNQGNVHMNFEGKVDIWQGKTKLRSVPLKRTLLSLDTAVFGIDVPDLPYLGKYRAVFKGKAFLAKTHKQDKLLSTTQFWYFPRTLVYALLAMLMVISISLIWLVKKWKSK